MAAPRRPHPGIGRVRPWWRQRGTYCITGNPELAAGTEGTEAACIGGGNEEPRGRSGSARGTRLDWATMPPHYTHRTSHNGLEIDAMCCTSQG